MMKKLKFVLSWIFCFLLTAPLPVHSQQLESAHELQKEQARLERELGKAVVRHGNAWALAGQLIVGFREKANQNDKFFAHAKVWAEVEHSFDLINAELVQLPEWMDISKAQELYKADERVAYAEPNYLVFLDDFTVSRKVFSPSLSQGFGNDSVSDGQYFPNDPLFSEQWALHNTGQTGGTRDADIDGPKAWNITKGNPSVVVAVIDTGVDYTHADLENQMWVNTTEANGTTGVDDDSNGYVDDIYGYDFHNSDADPMDDHGHGSHCAGIIAAEQDNGIGISGIAPRVRIMAIKAFSERGRGFVSDIIKALEYATAMNATLTSNSYSFFEAVEAVKEAILVFGRPTICAAGNNASFVDPYPEYPAGYNCDNIVSVLAIDHDDLKADFSNYGDESVDVGAPGVDVLSAVLNNGYEEWSGTSMATPYVAGVVALVISAYPDVSTLGAIQRVLYLGDFISALKSYCLYGRRVNARLALAASFNYPPEAHNISVKGRIKVGRTLTAKFTYFDRERDPQGTHQFQWYRADDDKGTGKTEISGATHKKYTIAKEQGGYYLCVKVIPGASSGTSPGIGALSQWYGPVASAYPIVRNLGVSTQASTWASCIGNAFVLGGEPISERGFVYALEKPEPTYADHVARAGSGQGQFTAFLKGLSPTNYYYYYYARAYAKNSAGIAYSDEVYFLPFSATSDETRLNPLGKDEHIMGFGGSISVSGDYAIVGEFAGDERGPESGCAYIFYRNQGGPGKWGLVKKITVKDVVSYDLFGRSVSLSGDCAIVAATKYSQSGVPGAVYVFYRNRGGKNNWGQVKKLMASDTSQNTSFGHSVSLSGDYAIVGAFGDDERAILAGAAYIFHRNKGGVDNWGLVKKLTASDAVEYGWFGYSVCIPETDASGYAIVGTGADEELAPDARAAYIFHRNEGGLDNWGLVKKLTASDAVSEDGFGRSVSIDGRYAVVGALSKNTDVRYAGAVYIFERNKGGANNWGQVKKIANPDPEERDFFGEYVSVSGTKVFVGCAGDNERGTSAGAVYIFGRDKGGQNRWGKVKKLTGSNIWSRDFFGCSVSTSKDTFIVGAWQALPRGAAYVFPVDFVPVDNPPEVFITSPNKEDIIPGTITVRAEAVDDRGINRVEFYINGSLKKTDRKAPYEYKWDTSSLSNGSYTLKVKAFNSQGQSDKDEILVYLIPHGPLNVTGVKKNNSTVLLEQYITALTWDAHDSNRDIALYRIYEVEGGAWNLVGEVGSSVREFTHFNVEKDKIYTYAVKAVDRNGKEGAPAFREVQ